MVFIYAAIVTVLLLISLCYKAFLIVQRSRFDGEHRFTVAIAKNNRVEQVLSVDPATAGFSVLDFSKTPIPYSSIGGTLGLAVDAKLNTTSDLPPGDISQAMQAFLLRDSFIEKDITVYDLARLALISRNTPTGNRNIKQISLPMKDKDIDYLILRLFTDQTISSENVSIQIINASNLPGMGLRLDRVLANMGANIVDITTARTTVSRSKIQYYDKPTYTLQKLERILKYPVERVDKEGIGDIVITIGEDSKGTEKF